MRFSKLVFLFLVLLLTSDLCAQNYATQSRTMSGGGLSNAQRMQQWNEDTKLYTDKSYLPKKNQLVTGKSNPDHLSIGSIGEIGHHRFRVNGIIDEETTLLQIENKNYILVEYKNHKLKVGEFVRLVPAVKSIEKQKHEEKELPTFKLTTSKAYFDYMKRIEKNQK